MGVAWGSHEGGFGVALGWLCTPEYMASIWPCGGFGWLKRSRFRVQGSTFKVPCSSPGDDLHNLQPVACAKLALGEFRWRHGFAVVLHHHAARQEFLRDQELLDRAGNRVLNGLPVGDDVSALHNWRCAVRGGCRRHFAARPMVSYQIGRRRQGVLPKSPTHLKGAVSSAPWSLDIPDRLTRRVGRR